MHRKGTCVGNTYFKHRVARGLDSGEIKNMTNLVLVKMDMLLYVKYVRAVRGMRRGLSDHNVILCKIRLVGAWIKRRELVISARRIRSEKLREH